MTETTRIAAEQRTYEVRGIPTVEVAGLILDDATIASRP